MPGSARENDQDVIEFVRVNNIKTVLDVGAGKGTYGLMLKDMVDEINAVEVWQPYVDQFNLRTIYDFVIQMDARHLNKEMIETYDLVIFGDILEHMSSEESLQLWEVASAAKFGLISVPIIHYPQGEEFGNPYEVHVQEHMHVEDIQRDYGPFIFEKEYEITGTFIKEFE